MEAGAGSSPQDRLVILIQGCIDDLQIINTVLDEIPDDQVSHTAGRQGIFCPGQKVGCIRQVQLQGDRQGQDRRLARMIGRIGPDLGKELPVNMNRGLSSGQLK